MPLGGFRATCNPPRAVPQVGARLISHAGSLTNLAKYPASTVQILGAEKALFRYRRRGRGDGGRRPRL